MKRADYPEYKMRPMPDTNPPARCRRWRARMRTTPDRTKPIPTVVHHPPRADV
jgi:hypothetical protein